MKPNSHPSYAHGCTLLLAAAPLACAFMGGILCAAWFLDKAILGMMR